MVDRGWIPVALHTVGPDGKTCSCPKGTRCGKSAGKHPILNDWAKITDATKALAKIDELLTKRRRLNLGILTGEPSGVFVLDVDVDRTGGDDMRRAIEEHGKFPSTYIVKTGTGGYHYYFKMPDFALTNRDKPLRKAGYNGLDIRGNGGQVAAPPSVSWAGPYAVQREDVVAEAPGWLLDLLRPAEAEPKEIGTIHGVPVVEVPEPAKADGDDLFAQEQPASAPTETVVQTPQQAAYERSIVNGELKRLAELPAIGWNGVGWDITTFEVACQLVELANADWSTLTLEEAESIFLGGAPAEEPGYDPPAKWESALNTVGDKKRPAPQPRKDVLFEQPAPAAAQGPSQAGGANRKGTSSAPSPAFSLSDLGNADRLIHWFGDRIRYAADAQQWLTYDAGLWSSEVGEVEVEFLSKKALAQAAVHEASQHSDVPTEFTKGGDPKPSEREEFFGWLGKSQMYAKVVAMRSMARSDLRVRTALGLFDLDPMMFNAANCAIDLTTGKAVDHAPEQMFRHQSKVAYDPDAKCPLWDSFLLRVQPDPEMREYLQMVLGYSMTGRMDEHALFIHNGQGATGKTTFLEVVGAVLGNYGQKLERDTLMSKGGSSGGGATPDVARMAGARFLAASETAAGKKLDDERIKEFVGGDTMTARELYGKPFEFVPTGKIHMATNHLPSFESGGDGMGRRLKLIPWEVQIPEPERDKTLKDRIVATEAAGVLAWLVRGAVAWAKRGDLPTPSVVVERSKEHVQEADPLWPYINERLTSGEDYVTEFTDILHNYEMWCQSNGQRPMSGRAFSMGLRERLGPNSKFQHPTNRRSCFRVKVALQEVPAHHDQFFKGQRA